MQSLIRFDSLTNAQTAKRLLFRNGVNSAIRRDPKPDRRRGCGFVLYVPQQSEQAEQLLIAHGLLSAKARDA